MSDDIKENEESTPPATPDEMRQVLQDTMRRAYIVVMEILSKLPIHPGVKQNALSRFDEGLMWTERGIANIQFSDGSESKDEEEKPSSPEENSEKDESVH